MVIYNGSDNIQTLRSCGSSFIRIEVYSNGRTYNSY